MPYHKKCANTAQMRLRIDTDNAPVYNVATYNTHLLLHTEAEMALIGIRELRERTTEVLRKVREENAEYIITYQGRPVALLLPVDAQAVEAAMLQAGKESASYGWEIYSRLSDVLRQTWPSGKATQTLMDELRRE